MAALVDVAHALNDLGVAARPIYHAVRSNRTIRQALGMSDEQVARFCAAYKRGAVLVRHLDDCIVFD